MSNMIILNHHQYPFLLQMNINASFFVMELIGIIGFFQIAIGLFEMELKAI